MLKPGWFSSEHFMETELVLLAVTIRRLEALLEMVFLLKWFRRAGKMNIF